MSPAGGRTGRGAEVGSKLRRQVPNAGPQVGLVSVVSVGRRRRSEAPGGGRGGHTLKHNICFRSLALLFELIGDGVR